MVSFFTEVCASLSLKGRERRRAGPCAQEQVRSSQRRLQPGRLTLPLACVAVVLCPQPGGPSWGGKSCCFPSSPRLSTCHGQTVFPQAMFTHFSNRWAAPPCLGRVRKGNEKQGFSLCCLDPEKNFKPGDGERASSPLLRAKGSGCFAHHPCPGSPTEPWLPSPVGQMGPGRPAVSV